MRGVSIPQIPGYTIGDGGTSLTTMWSRPVGGYPAALWPSDRLKGIDSSPSGWVVVEERLFTPSEHGGRGCVLVDAGSEEDALRGHDLDRTRARRFQRLEFAER